MANPNLVVGLTTEERQALTEQLVRARPDLADSPGAQEDALQAIAIIGLRSQLSQAVSAREMLEQQAADEAEAEAAEKARQERAEAEAAAFRRVENPLMPGL